MDGDDLRPGTRVDVVTAEGIAFPGVLLHARGLTRFVRCDDGRLAVCDEGRGIVVRPGLLSPMGWWWRLRHGYRQFEGGMTDGRA